MKASFHARILVGVAISSLLTGCRGHQFGHVIKDNQSDLVGSHTAGAETFNPLIDEAVGKLLARQGVIVDAVEPATYGLPTKRVCFVGVENCSSEELGDFKEQIYEIIDERLVHCSNLQTINRRFIDAGLMQTRLRPDACFCQRTCRHSPP